MAARTNGASKLGASKVNKLANLLWRRRFGARAKDTCCIPSMLSSLAMPSRFDCTHGRPARCCLTRSDGLKDETAPAGGKAEAVYFARLDAGAARQLKPSQRDL